MYSQCLKYVPKHNDLYEIIVFPEIAWPSTCILVIIVPLSAYLRKAISSGQISCMNTSFLLTFRGISIYHVGTMESSSLSNLLFLDRFLPGDPVAPQQTQLHVFFSLSILQMAKGRYLKKFRSFLEAVKGLHQFDFFWWGDHYLSLCINSFICNCFKAFLQDRMSPSFP